jgi:hypothetical protein
MAFLDHNGESEFPISKDKVFDAMSRAIPTIKGMKIDNADKLQGRITVKAGVSLWSWGENIPIQLIELSENKTRVQITSSPKTGILFGGALDMGKNRKNIETILSTTSRILSNPQNQSTENNQQPINNQTNNFQTTQNSNFMEQQNTNSNAWYEKTWLVIILCIIFFPVGLYALWKNSSISKGWKIGVTVIIALIVIANIGGKNDKSQSATNSTTNENSTSTAEPTRAKQWTTVYTFKGNGMKKSPVFELTGGDARLKYSYKAPGGIGMGMFSVYVVDEGEDIMKTGGIPEVMTQAENEDSESAIQKGSGRYYLNVNASGNWVVTVEELK